MASPQLSSEARIVLKLGRALAESLEKSSPTVLDELDQYCDAFAKWEATWRRQLDGRADFPTREVELGKRIVEQHARVIRLTEDMRANVDRSLKSLRVRGKGLRAYTDYLPKRISTMKRRG